MILANRIFYQAHMMTIIKVYASYNFKSKISTGLLTLNVLYPTFISINFSYCFLI